MSLDTSTLTPGAIVTNDDHTYEVDQRITDKLSTYFALISREDGETIYSDCRLPGWTLVEEGR